MDRRPHLSGGPARSRSGRGDGWTVVIDAGDIAEGQNVWQAMGGMEVGSIWGHGSYVAPDWTADWLHREAMFILDAGPGRLRQHTTQLDGERQAQLREPRCTGLCGRIRYDPARRTLTIEPVRAEAFEATVAHYGDVFGNGRTEYAIPAGTVTDPASLRELTAFFFWTSWAASTNRAGDTVTYTSNWPHEPLVGNRPTGEAVVWTGVSIIVLLAGIGAMASWYAAPGARSDSRTPPIRPAPRFDADAVAAGDRQVLLGRLGADPVQIVHGRRHGALRGRGRRVLRHPARRMAALRVTRTWHLQLGISLDRDRVARRRAVHRAGGQRR